MDYSIIDAILKGDAFVNVRTEKLELPCGRLSRIGSDCIFIFGYVDYFIPLDSIKEIQVIQTTVNGHTSNTKLSLSILREYAKNCPPLMGECKYLDCNVVYSNRRIDHIASHED